MSNEQLELLKEMKLGDTLTINQSRKELDDEIKSLDLKGYSVVAAGMDSVVVFSWSVHGALSAKKVIEALSVKTPFANVLMKGSISTVRYVVSRFNKAHSRAMAAQAVADGFLEITEDWSNYTGLSKEWLEMWNLYVDEKNNQFNGGATEPADDENEFNTLSETERVIQVEGRSDRDLAKEEVAFNESERLCWLTYDDRHSEHTAET